jgi:hypothetical protein
MKLDKLTIAGIIGVTSTSVYEVFTRILIYLGIGKYSIYQLDGFIVSINRINSILGLVISCIVSGWGTVLFYLAITHTNSNCLVIKNIMFTLLMWGILEAVFTGTIEGKFIPIRPISDYYIHMCGSIILGITQGLLLKIFLFKKPVS